MTEMMIRFIVAIGCIIPAITGGVYLIGFVITEIYCRTVGKRKCHDGIE